MMKLRVDFRSHFGCNFPAGLARSTCALALRGGLAMKRRRSTSPGWPEALMPAASAVGTVDAAPAASATSVINVASATAIAIASHLTALLVQFRMEFLELGFAVFKGEYEGQALCWSHVLTQGICKGCLLRCARVWAVTASTDGTAKLWSTQTGQCLQTFSGHTSGVNSVVFVPKNPEEILTASTDSTLRYWSVCSGKCVKTVRFLHRGCPVNVLSAIISPNSEFVLVNYMVSILDNFTIVMICQVGTLEERMLLTTEGKVATAVFSNGGHLALTSSDAGSVMVFTVATAERTLTIKHPGIVDMFLSAVFSSDDSLIATLSTPPVTKIGTPVRIIDAVQIWSATTGELLQLVHHSHNNVVRSIEFMANAMHLLTASDDMTAGIWSRNPPTSRSYNHTCSRIFTGHEGCVRSVHFSSDEIWVLTASSDCSAKIWCVVRGVCLLTLQGHAASLTAAVFSPASLQIHK